ncbi:MAG: hypothetical protein LBB62_07140 [Proteiniphilum sp.]|jgi:hypothetical protein|nr:hypothetical protein [Proteiniphilum sp.]
MAGWQDLETYIKSTYNYVTELDFGYVIVFVSSNGEVVGKALVSQAQDTSSGTWAKILVPMEGIKSENLDALFEYVVKISCGALVKIGDDYCLRHSVLIEPFSGDVFHTSLMAVLASAMFVESSVVKR